VKRFCRLPHKNILINIDVIIRIPPMSGVPALEAEDGIILDRGVSLKLLTYNSRIIHSPKNRVTPKPVIAAHIARKLRYWNNLKKERGSIVSKR
tara:strand:- start:91178 stop:91459 length:282 start_codon:yes stop_codon:yes gene_type:complete